VRGTGSVLNHRTA